MTKKKRRDERRAQKIKKKKQVARKAKRKALKQKTRLTNTKLDLGPKPSREVPPVENLTVEQYISMMIQQDSPFIRNLKRIRNEKVEGTRQKPSSRLISTVTHPPIEIQKSLLDKVAELVDENLFGRSEMCLQFASLVALGMGGRP